MTEQPKHSHDVVCFLVENTAFSVLKLFKGVDDIRVVRIVVDTINRPFDGAIDDNVLAKYEYSQTQEDNEMLSALGYDYVKMRLVGMTTEHLYSSVNTDIKKLSNSSINELPIGAMYYMNHMCNTGIYWENDDTPFLHVVCPDGFHWNIDARASNCTRKGEKTHRCWVRHGDAPNITVDKHGHTCSAGAGSISTAFWYHGHLVDGRFTISK